MTPVSAKTTIDAPIPEKPTDCGWGRTFSKIVSGIGQVAKAALVFGFFFAPVVTSSLYMTPGQVLARKGTASCGLNKYVFTPEKCSEVTTRLYTEYMITNSDYRFTPSEIDQKHEKGIERKGLCEHEGTTFRFLIPQARMENYDKALIHAKWAFASCTWDDTNKTLEILKQLHSILTAHGPDSGILRKNPKVLQSYFHTDDAKLDLSRVSLTPKDHVILSTTDPTKYFLFTPEEKAAWDKLLYVSPCDVAGQMKPFLQEFHRRMREGGDYIDHASYFHAELTRIAPFHTGVGRLARLMTNVILEFGELSSVVFADHYEYIEKVREGTQNRAVFTQYLRNAHEWTKKNLPHLEDASRRRIIDEARVMLPGLTITNVGRQANGQKIDPELYHNYQQALFLLQQHNIFRLSPEGLLNLIKKLHIQLTQNLEQDKDDPFILGKYRTGYMVVDGVGDPMAMLLRAQDFLGSRFIDFIPSFTKVQQDVTHLGRLSKDEEALWKEVAHIPPPPDKIAEQMLAFAYEFEKRKRNDPLELASFVHMELARIWPYGDANGRLARMMMNEVLRISGKKFITFPTQTSYYNAVAEAIDDYSKFTNYISKLS